jgi:hypothetical protein
MIRSTVVMSMTKAEYMVAVEATKEALWLTEFFRKQVFNKVEFRCIVTARVSST